MNRDQARSYSGRKFFYFYGTVNRILGHGEVMKPERAGEVAEDVRGVVGHGWENLHHGGSWRHPQHVGQASPVLAYQDLGGPVQEDLFVDATSCAVQYVNFEVGPGRDDFRQVGDAALLRAGLGPLRCR